MLGQEYHPPSLRQGNAGVQRVSFPRDSVHSRPLNLCCGYGPKRTSGPRVRLKTYYCYNSIYNLYANSRIGVLVFLIIFIRFDIADASGGMGRGPGMWNAGQCTMKTPEVSQMKYTEQEEPQGPSHEQPDGKGRDEPAGFRPLFMIRLACCGPGDVVHPGEPSRIHEDELKRPLMISPFACRCHVFHLRWRARPRSPVPGPE
jgi:hypothetical protein